MDFGNAYGTRRLRWNTTALYDLPFGRGKQFGGSMSRAADVVVGGWRLSSILTVQTGPYETPYFPNGQGDPSGTGSGLNGSTATGPAALTAATATSTPTSVTGVSVNPTGKTRFNWTNANAFACPGDSTWTPGNACATGAGYTPQSDGTFVANGTGSAAHRPLRKQRGRIRVEGPGLVNLSAGLSKTLSPSPNGCKVKAEGTFTNVLNHTNLGDPNMDLSSAASASSPASIGSDFGGARTGQISLRAEF